ncbi:sugar nucleotide-binding protein [bacterium]|nr:sugar nucleotide-binding protein [bacterium]
MRKRVAIIGSTGMLGSSVYKVLKDKCDLILTARSQQQFDQLEKVYGGTSKHRKIIFDAIRKVPEFAIDNGLLDLVESIGEVDLVINCIGVLNKFSSGKTPTPREYFRINTELPINLSQIYGRRLIHPSTDCIFDGTAAPYTESSPPAPSYGLYGYAKLFADEAVKEHSQVFRCCLIGEELCKDSFQMFTWFKRQKSVGGYTNWIITPITGVEFGKMCWRILSESIKITPNLLHLATPAISKYDILHQYKELNGLDIELIQDDSVKVNKTLTTEYPEELAKLRIADFATQLKEL